MAGDPAGQWLGATRRCVLGNLGLAAGSAVLGARPRVARAAGPVPMWGQLETSKVVGGLFPNDGDGNAWGDPKPGFPPALAKQGFTLR